MANGRYSRRHATAGERARVLLLAIIAAGCGSLEADGDDSIPVGVRSASLAQDALINGSFETPLIASDQTLSPLPDNFGWRVHGNVSLVNGGVVASVSPYRYAPPMGRQWVSLRPGTSITQAVTLTAGSYYVTVQGVQTPGAPASASVSVKLGASALATLAPTASIAALSFGPVAVAAGTYDLTIEVPQPVVGASVPLGVLLDDVVLNTTAVNSKPSVAIASPNPGQSMVGKPVELRVTANDPDGVISKVELYDGAILLATLTSPPWNYSLYSSVSATHTITAKAYDASSLSVTSDPTQFTIAPTGGVAPYVFNGSFEYPSLPSATSVYGFNWWVNNTSPGWVVQTASGITSPGYVNWNGGVFARPLSGAQSLLIQMAYNGGYAYTPSSPLTLPAGSYALSFKASFGWNQFLRAYPPDGAMTEFSTMPSDGRMIVPFTTLTAGPVSVYFQAYNRRFALWGDGVTRGSRGERGLPRTLRRR
jgi:hypothetical protein